MRRKDKRPLADVSRLVADLRAKIGDETPAGRANATSYTIDHADLLLLLEAAENLSILRADVEALRAVCVRDLRDSRQLPDHDKYVEEFLQGKSAAYEAVEQWLRDKGVGFPE